MKTDEQFKAALRAYQSRTRTSARSRMLAAADEAAALVVQRMRDGDLRAALAFLRGAGTLDPNASLTKELDADPAAQKQDSATPDDAKEDASVEARVRGLLGALSPEESTRLLQALAESSQPRLPEAERRRKSRRRKSREMNRRRRRAREEQRRIVLIAQEVRPLKRTLRKPMARRRLLNPNPEPGTSLTSAQPPVGRYGGR